MLDLVTERGGILESSKGPRKSLGNVWNPGCLFWVTHSLCGTEAILVTVVK